MHEHDDDISPLRLERIGAGVDLVDDAGDLQVADAGRVDQGREFLGDGAHEADLDPVDGLDPAVGQRVAVVGALAHVRGEVFPLRSAVGVRRRVVRGQHTVHEVVVSLVELVVARCRDIKSGGVEHVDGGLVLRDEGLEGGCPDQVARRGEHHVRVGRPQGLDLADHDGRAGLTGGGVGQQSSVEVIDPDHGDVPGVSHGWCRCGQQSGRYQCGGAHPYSH